MSRELASLGVELMLSPYMQFAMQGSVNYASGAAARSFGLGSPGTPDAGVPARLGFSGYNQAGPCLTLTLIMISVYKQD